MDLINNGNINIINPNTFKRCFSTIEILEVFKKMGVFDRRIFDPNSLFYDSKPINDLLNT